MKRFLSKAPDFMSHRRVVVTGIGAITPMGNNFQTTWENITSKNSDKDDFGITSLERALRLQHLPENMLDHDLTLSKLLPSQVAAPVRDVPFGGRTARFVQFSLLAAEEALKSSNLNEWLNLPIEGSEEEESIDETTQYRRTRAGTSIATGMSSIRQIVDNYQTIMEKKTIRRMNPLFVPQILPNASSSRVSLQFGLQGPNLVECTACAAGAHAIGEAMRCIQHDDADIMIAGGTEAAIDPMSMAGFSRLRALSTKYNDDPLRASRPFDEGRDGFVMGEGSSILILEEMEHAKMRGAKILCELRGYGLSGDAYHITSPDPDGKGAERAMRMALKRAGIKAGEVDYVNAHATSTPIGDEIEANTIHRVLSEDESRTNDLHVSSTKGDTGHLLGAAGAIEAAFTVQSIVDGLAPPTKNLNLMEKHDLGFFKHVNDGPINKDITVSVNNSFGFGGTNACLVFAALP